MSHTDLLSSECCDHSKALSDFGDATIAMSIHEDTVQHPAVIGDSEEGPEVVSAQDHPCLDQLLTANGDLEEGDTGASCSYPKVVHDTGASCSYIFPDLPPHVEVYTREFVNQLGASNLIQMPICLEYLQLQKHQWTPQFASLFDIGASCSFIAARLVERFKWQIQVAPATVKNGDGSKSLSPGVIFAKIRIGAFIKTVQLRVAPLDKFDVIIGKDLIDECKMEVRWDPFRITALTRTGRKGSSSTKRVMLPVCFQTRRAPDGTDVSDYVCDSTEFKSVCQANNMELEEAMVLLPSDGFEWLQFIETLNSLVEVVTDSDEKVDGEAESASMEFQELLTSTLAEHIAPAEDARRRGGYAKEKGKNSFTAPTAEFAEKEVTFRNSIVQEYPNLCSDTLPKEGPSAKLPDGTPYKVKLRLKPGAVLQSRRQFRIPEAYRPELQKTIENLIEFRLIEPSVSQYTNPVFLVPKPNRPDGTSGGLRFVWDGRSINKALESDSYLIPRVDDLIDRVGRLRTEALKAGKSEIWISTIDLRTSFWQLLLDEESRPLTAFSTSVGQFQWVALPMGCLVSAAHMQRYTEALLAPFSRSNTFEYTSKEGKVITAFGAAVGYIDDVGVITFGSIEEHEIFLRRILLTMEKQNVRIQPPKCEFFRKEANFLGHVLTYEGIRQQPSKLTAITNFPPLKDLKTVRSFVSLCSYYRKFVKDFAGIARPLTDLLKADGWKTPIPDDAQKAFGHLKTALTTAPVLSYFDVSAPTKVSVDASGYAIGGVLEQETAADGHTAWHPIGFYSRRLTSQESSKSAYDRELIGLRDTCLAFRHLLLGVPFTVYTDHQSLRWLFSQQELTGIHQRWLATLSQFDMVEIKHIEGRHNIVPDTLSRFPQEDGESFEHLIAPGNMETSFSNHLDTSALCNTEFFFQVLTRDADTPSLLPSPIPMHSSMTSALPSADGYEGISALHADPDVSSFIANYASCPDFQNIVDMLSSDPEKAKHVYPGYSFDARKILLFFDGVAQRVCVPSDNRQLLLRVMHDLLLGAHLGSKKFLFTLQKSFFWPKMASHVDKYVMTCEHCQRNKSYNANTRGVPTPDQIPLRRFDAVALDILSGLPATKRGFDAIVVWTDRLTKRCWLVASKTTITAAEIAAQFLTTVFRSQGLPRVLLSDRDPKFVSAFWTHFFALLQTDIRLTSAYHKHGNGGSEKFNKFLLESLRSFVSARHDDWDEKLLYIEFAYNNSVNPATGFSPFFLQFAQSPRAPWDLLAFEDGGDAIVLEDLGNDLAQKARIFGLDVISNVIASRDALQAQAQKYRIRNMHLLKPHSYSVGDQVLLSTENIKMKLPCRKLGPPYVGPFEVMELVSPNSLRLEPRGRFRAISPFQNITFLRPYHLRTPDIGPTSQAASVQPVDSDPGGHWYEIDCVITHTGRPGPNQKMLVRWKGFQDVSDDSWIPRKHVTPLALEAYERFLTEYAKDRRDGNQDGQTLLASFIGLKGQFSCLNKKAARSAPSTEVSVVGNSANSSTDTSSPARTRFGRVSSRPATFRP